MSNFANFFPVHFLRIFQRNWLKLDKNLILSGLVKMCTSIEWRSLRKFDRSGFTQLKTKVGKECMGSYGISEKWR